MDAIEVRRRRSLWRPLVSLALLAMVTLAQGTTVTLYPAMNPATPGDDVLLTITVTGNFPLTHGLQFSSKNPGVRCDSPYLSGLDTAKNAVCVLEGLVQGDNVVEVAYQGDPLNPSAKASVNVYVGATNPSDGIVLKNPYGPLKVVGAQLLNNVLTAFGDEVDFYLGPVDGTPDSALEISFQAFDLGKSRIWRIHEGAPGQTIRFRVLGNRPSAITGIIISSTQVWGGTRIEILNPNGVALGPPGYVLSPNLFISTLGRDWYTGGTLQNAGMLYGGKLELRAARITGNGAFAGDEVILRSFGNMHNPMLVAQPFANGLKLQKYNSAEPIRLTLNAYGKGPQVVNLWSTDDLELWAPSQWPAGVNAPANSRPLDVDAVRPKGQPDPPNGGGSLLIMSKHGSLVLRGGGTNDFVFPGALVLHAYDSIDTAGVAVNQGWTTSGRAFQGMFFDAPRVFSSGGFIAAYTNAANWVNFASIPETPVRAFQLSPNVDGSASFSSADDTVPHLNSWYEISWEASWGLCWTCLVDPNPIDVFGP